jgi:type II secretory pathway pseudopilin PulG
MSPIRREGFTLIELLVVISIIMVLVGMVSSLIATSRNSAQRNATKAIMGKVDVALRQFKNECGAYPWQPSANNPDDTSGVAWSNRLAWNLGTDLPRADLLKLLADQDAAAAQYNYDCTPVGPLTAGKTTVENVAALSGVAYRMAWIQPSIHGAISASLQLNVAIFLNRMAQERARLAITAGNTGLVGPVIRTLDWTVAVDRRSVPVLTTSSSNGWAADYLGGEVEAKYRRDGQILDVWKRPLVYICQALPGVRMTTFQVLGGGTGPFNSAYYGLGAVGRAALARRDDGGITVPTDSTYFPDAGNLLGSDARYYCAPGYASEFELHSAGRDGRFGWFRNAVENRDNILGGDYQRGLQ